MEAAFFDLDKTVIAKASIAAFGRPLLREGLISRRTVLRAAMVQLIFIRFGADEERLNKVRDSMLDLTRGWDRDQVSQIVRETLIETIEPLIFAEALDLMDLHRKAGDKVYIVSAAPEEIVRPLGELLGVDGSLASRGELDDLGRYTGKMDFYCYGPNKAVAIERLAADQGINLAESTAYSDSATDIPMLEVVGHGVAVNPDKTLAAMANERGWEVMSFTKPVRIRDRVSRRIPMVTGAIAVLGAVAVGLARTMRRAPRRRAAN